MTTIKGLILASVAGLAAIGGARAADLPVRAKAPAVEYVRICTAYGAGFFFIPGTDTCLRVGGRARAEFDYATQRSTDADQTGFRGLGRLNLDARTATSFGTLRTFVRFEIARRTGVNRSGSAERQGLAEIATGVDFRGRAQTQVIVDKAFIQFAGITAGRASSFFDFYQNDLDFIGLTGSAIDSTNLFAYTYEFGSGFSATIAVEDPIERRFPVGFGTFDFGGTTVLIPDSSVGGVGGVGGQTTVLGATATPGFLAFDPVTRTFVDTGFDPVQRQKVPDIVGALRVDQDWGSAQVSAALHQINVAGLARTPGLRPDDEYGFAVQGGVKINLPMIAAGDVLWLQAAYSEGALSYTGSGLFGLATDSQGATNRFAVTSVDAAVTRYGDLKLTESFSAIAAFLHYWTPEVRQAVFAGITTLDYSGILRSEFGPNGLLDRTDVAFKDTSIYQIGSNLIYSPVADLDIGVEALYTRFDPRGRVVDNNKPITINGFPKLVSYDDQLIVRLRVQRDF